MNIREFAALCGISPSAASRILNRSQKDSQASPATYESIRRKAVELGFRPNYAAKTLHTRKSNCIGVIVGYPSMLNTVPIISGISACAYKHGMSLSIVGCRNNPRMEIKAFGDMRYHGVDAIIWHPTMQRQDGSLSYIEKTLAKACKDVPIVCLSYSTLPYLFTFNPNGEEDGASAALRQLRIGCKKFAVLRSAYCYLAMLMNKNAYIETLRRNGVGADDIIELVTDDPDNPPDWSRVRDVEGVWSPFLFMLHAVIPQLRLYCDLRRLHIDGQAFIEDYAVTQWTYSQSAGHRFEELFGSLRYHVLDGYKVAERATEIAIQAIHDPGLAPFAEPLIWRTPLSEFSPGEILFGKTEYLVP